MLFEYFDSLIMYAMKKTAGWCLIFQKERLKFFRQGTDFSEILLTSFPCKIPYLHLRFPEASRPRKWAKPTGMVYEHIIY